MLARTHGVGKQRKPPRWPITAAAVRRNCDALKLPVPRLFFPMHDGMAREQMTGRSPSSMNGVVQGVQGLDFVDQNIPTGITDAWMAPVANGSQLSVVCSITPRDIGGSHYTTWKGLCRRGTAATSGRDWFLFLTLGKIGVEMIVAGKKTSTEVITVDKLSTVGFSAYAHDSSGRVSTHANGITETDSEVVASNYHAAYELGLGAGYAAAASDSFDGIMHWMAFWDVEITNDEYVKLYEDPFALLAHRPAPIWFDVGGVEPPAGAIMNQLQGANLGADLFNGTIQ